jgi:hypothetical protein
MTEQDKTVKILLFDSNKKNFVMWWTRFKAYRKVQQLAQALRETPEASVPTTQVAYEALDKTDVADAAAVKAMCRNECTLANLAVAFTTTKAMTHFHKAGDLNWPDGLACNVVKPTY